MVQELGANPLADCMTESADGYVLALPASLPGEAAVHVSDLLLAARSNAVVLDAGAVSRIDTPCIQVLLSAARLWRDDGAAMTLSAQSETFSENIQTLGLTTAEFEVGDAHHA